MFVDLPLLYDLGIQHLHRSIPYSHVVWNLR